jgi:HEAT repeat protein
MPLVRSRFAKPLVLAGALSLFAAGCQESDPKSPATWIAKLDDTDPRKVGEALEQLRKLKAKEAVPNVVPLLKSENNALREAAAFALEEMGDKSAVDPLIASIDLASSAKGADLANKRIAEALGELGDPKAVPELLKMTNSKSWFVQKEAVDALGKLKDPRSLPVLIKLVEADETIPPLRKAAIVALGNLKAPEAIPALLKGLVIESTNASFFVEASFALLQLRPASAAGVAGILAGTDKPFIQWAADHKRSPAGYLAKGALALGDIADPATVPALVKTLQWKDADRNYVWEDLVHTHVAEALGRMHAKEAVAPMGAQFGGIVDANMRERYGLALALLGDKSVLPKVEAAIKDKKSPITSRAESVRTLGLLGDARNKPAIDAARKSDPPETLLKQCLAEAGDEAQTKDSCQKVTKDWAAALDEETARLAAGQECHDDAGCWAKKLTDASWRIRERAAFELGRSGTPASVQALLTATKDATNKVRRAVYFGLETAVSNPATQPLMKKQADVLAAQYAADKSSTALGGVNEDLKRLVWKVRNLP